MFFYSSSETFEFYFIFRLGIDNKFSSSIGFIKDTFLSNLEVISGSGVTFSDCSSLNF
jgi:hypothetical protein